MDYLKERKIIGVLASYIYENYKEIPLKKYLYINDFLSCIPKKESNNEFIKIFDDTPEYIYFLHENPIKIYIKIKNEIAGKRKNVLIVKRGNNLLLRSFNPQIIRISPRRIVEHYCKKNSNLFSIDQQINYLKYFIWDSLDFLKENYEFYRSLKKLNPKYLIEITFQEHIKENNEIISLLKIILLNEEKFIDILTKPSFKELREKYIEYMEKFFPEALKDILFKCISNKSFKELYLLLLIFSYIKQFNPDLSNFEKAFKFINQKSKLIQNFNFDDDIFPLTLKSQETSKISDSFLKKILEERLNNNIKIVNHSFDFPRIIKDFEASIGFNENYSIVSSYLKIPTISSLDENIIKIISHIWLSFNFLLHFIGNNLKTFFIKPEYYNFTSDLGIFIGLNFKAIDNFKNNLFYKIGKKGSEYWIKLRFLKNFFKNLFYLYNLKRDVFPNLSIINDKHDLWKLMFEKYYIPLNYCLEGGTENISQFIQSEIYEIEKYTSKLEILTIQTYNEINSHFVDYIKRNYTNWVNNVRLDSTPLCVINAIKRIFIPNFSYNPQDPKNFYLILVIDCCHLGLWNVLKQKILKDFPRLSITTTIGYSILPTSTKFARLGLFTGKFPKDFEHENELRAFLDQIISLGYRRYSRYNHESLKDHFIANCENIYDFKKANNKIKSPDVNFQITIFNFSDQVSHTYSQTFLKTMIKTIYNLKIRPLIELIDRMKDKNIFIFFATDHGSSRCTEQFIWEDDIFDQFYKKRNSAFFEKTGPRTFITYKEPSSINRLSKKIIAVKHTEAENWGLKKNKEIRIRRLDDIGFDELIKELNYFFAINYSNITYTRYSTRDPKKFGHGGLSMDEFIIPFAMIKRKKQGYEEFNGKLKIDLVVKEIYEEESYLIKIIIINKSNKDIIFKKGHLITESINYKFIKLDDKIALGTEKLIEEVKLDIRFCKEYIHFYFSYYQDEKLEKSKVYDYKIRQY